MKELGKTMEKKIKDVYGKKANFKKLTCPFCGLPLERPQELETRRPSEMPLGSCSCGAVYAYDASGHNLGTAFNEALVFACNMDWDLAWGLLPKDDYLTEIVENYDYETHLLIPGGVFEGRRISGALYFIRLHDDIQEVTQKGVQKTLEKAVSPAHIQTNKKQPVENIEETPAVNLSKKDVEEIVKNYDNIEQLLKAAAHDKKIVRKLQRLLYTGDELTRLRAAELLGKVSAVIAKKDPGAVSQLLRGLLSSVFDSASSSWGAIDAAGEIIGNSPGTFAGYLPALYQLLDDKMHQAKALRAIGKTAKAKPELVKIPVSYFIPYLNSDSAETRAYAAILAGNLKIPLLKGELERLKDDTNMIEIYEKGIFQKKTVGQLAAKALENIDAKTV